MPEFYLLFVAEINPYSVFKNFYFLFTFYLYKYIMWIMVTFLSLKIGLGDIMILLFITILQAYR